MRRAIGAGGVVIRIVVIGNGMAGTRLVQELRRHDPGRDLRITVVGAEVDAGYNRVLLSQVLAGALDVDEIGLTAPSWYTAENVTLLTGRAATWIDRDGRLVGLADGTVLPYDVLVLATGSRPWIPPIPGVAAGAHDPAGATTGPASTANAPAALQCTPLGSAGVERGEGAESSEGAESGAGVGGSTGRDRADESASFRCALQSDGDVLGLAPGVTAFRTLADCRTIIERLASVRRAVVLGGGLLGLEAARGLAGRGIDVEIVHPVDWLMERQLDAEAGRVLARTLRDLGVRTRLGVGAAEYVPGPDRTLVLSDGTRLPADLVVLSCGVRPDTELAAAAGLPVERGIVVDDRLRSPADPAVYAIGECAQHAGEVYGLVAPAWEQAAVLARVLTGGDDRYQGSRVVTRLKAADVDLAAMGDTHADDEDDSAEIVRFHDPSRGSYQKVVIRDGRLAGAIVVGESTTVGTITQLFDRATPVPRDRRALFFAGAAADSTDDPSRLPDRVTICRCNGVTKGAIASAWQQGARSVAEIADRTRATTGCGSCRQSVEGIVDWLTAADPTAHPEEVAV
ncbi:MAG TPA: FAD-dependent oxidoreductase [Jiangellaceae bacterium]